MQILKKIRTEKKMYGIIVAADVNNIHRSTQPTPDAPEKLNNDTHVVQIKINSVGLSNITNRRNLIG